MYQKQHKWKTKLPSGTASPHSPACQCPVVNRLHLSLLFLKKSRWFAAYFLCLLLGAAGLLPEMGETVVRWIMLALILGGLFVPMYVVGKK